MDRQTVVALVAGVIHGVFEWLPFSSEGNVAIARAALGSLPVTSHLALRSRGWDNPFSADRTGNCRVRRILADRPEAGDRPDGRPPR